MISPLSRAGLIRLILAFFLFGGMLVAISPDSHAVSLPVLSYTTSSHVKVAQCADASCSSANPLFSAMGSGISSTLDGTKPLFQYVDISDDLVSVRCTSSDCSTRLSRAWDHGPFRFANAVDSGPWDYATFTYAKESGMIYHVTCYDAPCDTYTQEDVLPLDTGDEAPLFSSTTIYGPSVILGISTDLLLISCVDYSCYWFEWQVIGSGPFSSNPSFSMTQDSAGLPFIAYTTANHSVRTVFCDSPTCSNPFLSRRQPIYAKNVAVSIPGDGLPIIVYQDLSNRLSLMKCSTPTCNGPSTTRVLVPGRPSSGAISIALNDSGNPVIGFFQDNTPNALPAWDGIVRVLTCHDSACVSFTPSPIIDTGADTRSLSLST